MVGRHINFKPLLSCGFFDAYEIELVVSVFVSFLIVFVPSFFLLLMLFVAMPFCCTHDKKTFM